jgi:hypothetical protein
VRTARWIGAALLCSSLGLRQVGLAQAVRSEPARPRTAERADAGHQLSEEDLEVLKNLELLEHLGESDDLELFLALSEAR